MSGNEMTDNFAEDFLQHYGVKGMKWGVRKNPGTPSARSQRKDAKKARSARDRASSDRADARTEKNFGGKTFLRPGSEAYKKMRVAEAQSSGIQKTEKKASKAEYESDLARIRKEKMNWNNLTNGEKVNRLITKGPAAATAMHLAVTHPNTSNGKKMAAVFFTGPLATKVISSSEKRRGVSSN